MTWRKQIGARNHSADAWQHNGNQDANGLPTYGVDGDWRPVITGWMVQLLAVNGGEQIRGRQVTAETSHVIFGQYSGGVGILPEHRVTINGTTYNVVSAMDMDGDQMELRVELKT